MYYSVLPSNPNKKELSQAINKKDEILFISLMPSAPLIENIKLLWCGSASYVKMAKAAEIVLREAAKSNDILIKNSLSKIIYGLASHFTNNELFNSVLMANFSKEQVNAYLLFTIDVDPHGSRFMDVALHLPKDWDWSFISVLDLQSIYKKCRSGWWGGATQFLEAKSIFVSLTFNKNLNWHSTLPQGHRLDMNTIEPLIDHCIDSKQPLSSDIPLLAQKNHLYKATALLVYYVNTLNKLDSTCAFDLLPSEIKKQVKVSESKLLVQDGSELEQAVLDVDTEKQLSEELSEFDFVDLPND